MNDPAAMPLAISMLGVEHLKAGQLDAALSELDQVVHLLPGRPENHANLACALFLTGQTERGLQEARKALQLDPGRPKSRLVLGMLLLQQGSHDAEAVQHLQAAAQEIPSAHLELAKHYDRAGQAPEAERGRRAFEVISMGFLAAKCYSGWAFSSATASGTRVNWPRALRVLAHRDPSIAARR